MYEEIALEAGGKNVTANLELTDEGCEILVKWE